MDQGKAGRAAGARRLERVRIHRIARRSALLTALSALVPGLGLVGTRHRRLGLITGAVTGLLALGALLATRGSGVAGALGYLAIRPDVLLTLMLCLVPVTLFWIFVVALTHRETRHASYDRFQRVALGLLTFVLCLLVTVPLVQFGRYAVAQRDALASVFTGRADRVPGPPWGAASRVNILLVGADVGSDKTRVSTDAIVVASIDPSSGDTLYIALPPSLQNAPFPPSSPLAKLWPSGYNCGGMCPLSGVWNEAANHPDLFKNDRTPGLSTLRGVVGQITGLDLHASVLVDLKSTPALLDALGGVPVTVTERLAVQPRYDATGKVIGAASWVDPGARRLDGTAALWWLRASPDDTARWSREQCLVRNVVAGATPMGLLRSWPDVARSAKGALTTDIVLTDVPQWSDLARRIQGGAASALVFTAQDTSAPTPDYARIRSAVRAAVDGSAASATPSPAAPTAAATASGAAKTTKSKTPAPPAPPPLPTAAPLAGTAC